MLESPGDGCLFLQTSSVCTYSYDGTRFRKTFKKGRPAGHVTCFRGEGLPIQRTLDSVDLSETRRVESVVRELEVIGTPPEDDQLYLSTLRLLMEMISGSALLDAESVGVSLTVVNQARAQLRWLGDKNESPRTDRHQHVVVAAGVVTSAGQHVACSPHTIDLNHVQMGLLVEELERKVTAIGAAECDEPVGGDTVLLLPSDMSAHVFSACIGCLIRRPRGSGYVTPWPDGLSITDDPCASLGYYQHTFDETGRPSVPYSLVDEHGRQASLISDIANGHNRYGTMRLLDGRNVMESVPSNVQPRLRSTTPSADVPPEHEYVVTSLTQLVFESLSSSGRIAFEASAISALGGGRGHAAISRCRIAGTPETVLGQFIHIGESVGHYHGDFSVSGSRSYLKLS